MVLSENKSFVVLRESGRAAQPGRNYRYFLESFDAFDEVTRSRFATVRARMMYVGSLAYDRQARRLYTVSVPNSKMRRLVVCAFDRNDMTLAEEYAPAVAAGSGVLPGDGKLNPGDFFVTGATVEDGRMYAVSAAHGTLLTIDLDSRSITGAYRIDGLDRPTGIASAGDGLFIVTESGGILIVDRPETSER
jgi:hypothetical protein